MRVPRPRRDVYIGRNIKVQVLDRALAERMTGDEPYASISITNREQDYADLAESPLRRGVLRLKFTDIPLHELRGDPLFPDLFSPREAGRVWEFYRAMRSLGVELFLVNCEKGKHRSAAVAAALLEEADGDATWVFRHFLPNQLVYDLLCAEADLAGGVRQV